jgi:hypothetical protein
MKNHRSRGLRGDGSPSFRHRAPSWPLALLWVGVPAACAPASVRSTQPVASAGASGSELELDAKAGEPRASGAVRLEKEHERLLRRRAEERLRLQLHIRDHDSRVVRDGG